MTDERLARLSTHRNNIARYRRLLQTHLTDHEREFIERRKSEEQSDFESLTAKIILDNLYLPAAPEAA